MQKASFRLDKTLRRVRYAAALLLLFLAVFLPSFKTQAYTSPEEAPTEKQVERTWGYAFLYCASGGFQSGWDDFASNGWPGEAMQGELSFDNAESGKLWDVGDAADVGHDIEPDDGQVGCGDSAERLKIINNTATLLGLSDADALVNKYWERGDDGWELKDGPNGTRVKQSLLFTDLLEAVRANSYAPSDDPDARNDLGPNERKRRVLVAVARCIAPIGNGVSEELEIDGETYTFKEGKYRWREGKGGSTRIAVGRDWQINGDMRCDTLVKIANNEDFLKGADLNALWENPQQFLEEAGVNSSLFESGSAGEGAEAVCETELTNPLTWIACPIINGAEEAIKKFDEYITKELTIDADSYMDVSDENNKVAQNFYSAWNGFRVLGLSLLIVFGLVMVISQALSLDMFDAYTVKKVLPRIIIAVIMVTLSWSLMKFAIELTNLVGVGVRSLIYAPFADFGNVDFSGGVATIFGGVALAGAGSALLGLGAFGLLSLAVTGLLAVFIGFAVIVFRRILIMLLVVVAPFAIVCSVLPNTEKVWKMWWDFFSKALIAFPIITLFIASGRVFAQIAASSAAEDTSTVEAVIAFIAYFGPYFAIPTAFRMAGGAIATVSGMANDRSRGFFDRQKKFRQETKAKNYEKVAGGTRWGGNAFGRRVSTGLQTATLASKAGYRPSRMRSNMQVARDKITAQQRAAILEDEDYASWKSNDTLNREFADARDAADLRQRLINLRNQGEYSGTDDDIDKDVARTEVMRRKYGTAAMQQRAVAQAIAGGTAYATAEDAWAAVGRVTQGDMSARSALVAEGRSAAMSAGRVDMGGNGFGNTLNYVNELADNAGGDNSVASATFHRQVLDSQGAGIITHSSMKRSAVEQLIPEIRSRISEAYASGDQTRIERELANAAGIYDGLAQNSPQNAELFGDQVMRWDPEAGDAWQNLPVGVAGPVLSNQQGPISGRQGVQTLQQRIEAARGSEVFRSTRREYGLENPQARGGQQPQGPGGPPSGPPTSPAGGP